MIDLDEVRALLDEWNAEAKERVAKERITGGVSELDFLIKNDIRERHRRELISMDAALESLDAEMNSISEDEFASEEKKYDVDIAEKITELREEIWLLIK
ncbi:hypothetical protein GGR79_001571 [Xanthomonas arboricola]|uniref:hypothetical protein n=1 Tax=Xanthomonas TaxID=338 RepID=UPI000CED8D04|nr:MULTISPECIES: hypothetical protein [Xanthomonas]MCC5074118.1 hypothetical protein [Xanthomonas campestris pv. plantaginis]NJC30104.1 hypothetical protein [Xanthomonas arboricola]PPU21882.1 hypothetical protein XarbCFBP7610_00690 [Xanthomonas arboricola]PPU34384.1 hypothetical protein XarbCFBP7604_11250 [Xanthomonas arboricola]